MKRLILYLLSSDRKIVINIYKGVQYEDKTIVLYCKELCYGVFLENFDAFNDKFKSYIIEWID